MARYSYVMLVRTGYAKQEAVASITYAEGLPTCLARAEADLKDRGHVVGRVRLEDDALKLATYKGTAWNCKHYTVEA